MPKEIPHKYNLIYSQLLPDNNDDIVGLIAYGIYKRKKIEFIKQYIEDNEGKDPDSVAISGFHMASLHHIDGYILEATELSHDFVNEYWNEIITQAKDELEKNIIEIEKEYRQKTELECGAEIDRLQREEEKRKLVFDNEVSSLKPNFWFGVSQSITASILVLFVVFFLFVITEGYRADVINTIRNFSKVVENINSADIQKNSLEVQENSSTKPSHN